MGWVDGEVDGVAIKRCSIVGNSEWEKVFEQFMEYELASLKNREDMGTGFGDPFNDTSDVSLSNAYLCSGALRNTETTTGGISLSNIVPMMTSNTSPSPWKLEPSSTESGFPAYHAFNRNKTSLTMGWLSNRGYSGGIGNEWLLVSKGGSSKIELSQIRVYPAINSSGLIIGTPKNFVVEGSNNKSSWATIYSASNLSGWSIGSGKAFTFSPCSYNYIRIRCTKTDTAYFSGSWFGFGEIEIGCYTPSVTTINPATITLDSYTSTEILEAVKVKLWLENLDNSVAISCGNSGNDKIEAYLSYNSNSSFTPALNFPVENIRPAYSGSNIYIFTSEEIDVSTQSISGLGLKIKSFARSVAPNFKLHGSLVVGRPIVEK